MSEGAKFWKQIVRMEASVKTRMLLLASVFALPVPAFAADLAPQPVEPEAPVYLPFSWTGFYLGAHVGGAFGTAGNSYPATTTLGDFDTSGFVGGIHAGYNYQWDQFVLGAEADFDGTSLRKRETDPAFGSLRISTPWQGSVRARLGYAYDRLLIYGTGGVAFAEHDFNYTSLLGNGTSKFDDTRAGWTLGAGLEYAFTNNWTARAEYRYTDYGKKTYATVDGPIKSGFNDHQVLVGFSYKF
jgi:outer membrane immunogenic protein